MNKKWLILLIPVIIVLACCIVFLIQRSRVELYETDGGTALSIIGESDGPTSIFIAGKLGDNDTNIDEKIEIQIGNTVKIAELESNASTDELEKFLSGNESEVIIRLLQ